MKFLIILVVALTTALSLPSNEIKSDSVVAVAAAGRPEGRITNGKKARAGVFPYHVGVRRIFKSGGKSWCGGTLISNTHVLTAAHCTKDAVKAIVLLGSTERNAGEIVYEVDAQDIVIHEAYEGETKENDISLIKIPFTNYTKNIQAVEMPKKSITYPSYSGEMAATLGWGVISDSATALQDFLRYAYVMILPNYMCEVFFRIKPTNLCISTATQASICHGDSGGSLALASNKTLVGIASFVSKTGCEKKLPAMFTRVSSYIDWIEQNSR